MLTFITIIISAAIVTIACLPIVNVVDDYMKNHNVEDDSET